MKKNSLSVFEIIWYSITGLIALWGLTYLVLGIVVENWLPTTAGLAKANDKIISLFKLGFLYWGLIILAIGVVSASVVLCICARKVDRTSERETRRNARLAAFQDTMSKKEEILESSEQVK